MKGFSILAATFWAVVGMTGCDSPSNQNDTESAWTAVTGRVLLVQVADLSPSDLEAMPEEIWSAVEESGWFTTPRGLEREKPLTGTLLRKYGATAFGIAVDGRPITIGEEGEFAVDLPDRSYRPSVTLLMDGEVVGSEVVQVEWVAQNERSPEIHVLWHKLRDQHGLHDHHAGGDHDGHGEPTEEDGLQKSHIACLDYNGRFGNCRNYSSGWRRYANFVLSDCDYAWGTFGLCWLDQFGREGADRFCDGSRNCSSLIGHAQREHCH